MLSSSASVNLKRLAARVYSSSSNSSLALFLYGVESLCLMRSLSLSLCDISLEYIRFVADPVNQELIGSLRKLAELDGLNNEKGLM
ncbi:hypothetical protein D3C80_1445030 [compost metagenome]